MSTISKERFNEILREEIVREREEQKELNEFFGLDDLKNAAIEKTSGMFTGATKQKIADMILFKLGVLDPNARMILSQVIEQLSLNDMKVILKGGPERCDVATEIIFRALCEVLGRKLFEVSRDALTDVPEIGGAIKWLGGSGTLNQAVFGLTSEAIENQLSDPNTVAGEWMHVNVLPRLREKICTLLTDTKGVNIKDLALGKLSSAGAAASDFATPTSGGTDDGFNSI